MRSYFVRIPSWARMIYPSAVWKRDDIVDPQNQLHITIDDGPHPESTPKWLRLLGSVNQRATFFVLGEEAKKYSSLMDEIKSEGHQIASHGMRHMDGWRSYKSTYTDQVRQSLDQLETSLYRPPYGRMTPAQHSKLSKDCQVIMWSLMPGDFHDQTTEHHISKRLEGVRTDDIIVFHDAPAAFNRTEKTLLQRYA